MKQIKKKNSVNKGLVKQTKKEQQHQEMQQIFKQAELPILQQFSDETLDKENEKIELLSGNIYSWKELYEAHLKLKNFINPKLREWELTFPEELYRQWRRLNGWEMNAKSRPMKFAYYTVRDVYGSLPKEVYKTLDGINGYLYPGIRMYRYCQLLTEECHEKVKEIINTIITLANKSNDIYEYRLKLAAVYGSPFSKTVLQLDAFRNNEEILKSI